MDKQSNQKAQEPSSKQSSAQPKEPSDYKMVKDGGWSSRPHFQASYGLKMDPDGIEEGNAILDAMRQADKQSKGK